MKYLNQSKLWFFSLLIALSTAVSAVESANNNEAGSTDDSNKAGIYRDVNDDGVVEFSDQGSTSSKKIKLKTTNTFKAAKKKFVPSRSNSNSEEPTNTAFQKAVSYKTLSITSPTPDQQIRSNDGILTVSLAVKPALNTDSGDQIELYYDGVSQGKQQGLSFVLKDVFRGQHRIQAKLINKSGTVLKISKPVQFVIFKHSILFPKAR